MGPSPVFIYSYCDYIQNGARGKYIARAKPAVTHRVHHACATGPARGATAKDFFAHRRAHRALIQRRLKIGRNSPSFLGNAVCVHAPRDEMMT